MQEAWSAAGRDRGVFRHRGALVALARHPRRADAWSAAACDPIRL